MNVSSFSKPFLRHVIAGVPIDSSSEKIRAGDEKRSFVNELGSLQPLPANSSSQVGRPPDAGCWPNLVKLGPAHGVYPNVASRPARSVKLAARSNSRSRLLVEYFSHRFSTPRTNARFSALR